MPLLGEWSRPCSIRTVYVGITEFPEWQTGESTNTDTDFIFLFFLFWAKQNISKMALIVNLLNTDKPKTCCTSPKPV